ncbi:unnamed protein product [Pleuronectes platessa]|uniref:Uncharacterized protein n=1 Tax=Pleuronectes platessa TaxID=8262 RepID=A0A9N7UZM3_PLEPL|nr:unnamed protein product [Pleuronectes platessa]
MSADTEEVTPPPDDTEEVTPPPDVTLGEEPKNEDQSSSSSCSCCSSCCCFPTRWRNSFPFFRRRSPDSSRSLDTSSDEDSSQWVGALMSIGSMDQPTSSR